MTYKERRAGLPAGFRYHLELAKAATPRLIPNHPIHRWFFFPHSYSPEMVETVLDVIGLPRGANVLDPFVGAGTTLVVGKRHGIDGTGLDLSLLSWLATSAKVAEYDPKELEEELAAILRLAARRRTVPPPTSTRMARALTPGEYASVWRLREAFGTVDSHIQRFYLLALLATLPKFSRAQADGGWFRWVSKPEQADLVFPAFKRQTEDMIGDLTTWEGKRKIEETCSHRWNATLHDARKVHMLGRIFDAVITSPPYLNRHDYSRVFQLELLTLGQSEEDIFRLRYSSLRSHVEARQPDNQFVHDVPEYRRPPSLSRLLAKLPSKLDRRVSRMINGYFEDMYLFLQSAQRALKPDAWLALVIGNVRHGGVMFPVDELLVEIAAEAGLRWNETWVIRLRGNSAQQMALYGREASRESIVFLKAAS
jgi:tRNA G10  N-methylase Trm11